MDGRCEGGPEEDGCHKLEDTCTQKRRLEDGREGGQGPTRTVEPCSSNILPQIRPQWLASIAFSIMLLLPLYSLILIEMS